MRKHPLILLIDDEEEFLEIASRKLAREGFDVAMAHTAPEALTKARDLMPDLILSDVYMPPGPNGWELALAVHHDPQLRDMKFAFFTSLHDPAAELSVEERDRDALAALRQIPIFSKTDDVSSLGGKIKEVIQQ